MKEYEINEPTEGLDTLVAQYSGFRIGDLVQRVQRTFDKDSSPRDIQAYLEEKHASLKEHMRQKVVLLVRGLDPPDDFTDDDVVRVVESEGDKIGVQLNANLDHYQPGDLVYFRGKRWVLSTRQDQNVILKGF